MYVLLCYFLFVFYIVMYICVICIYPPHYCMFIALVFLAHIYFDVIMSVTNVFLSTINKHFLLLLFNFHTGILSSHLYQCTCQNKNESDNYLRLYPKYLNISSNPAVPKFQQEHLFIEQIYVLKQMNPFFLYEPQKGALLAIRRP